MTGSDCPSSPFQASMILPLKNREREQVAKSDPTVPVPTQGQQLEGTHCRNIHMSYKWARACWRLDLALSCSQGRQRLSVAEQLAGLSHACAQGPCWHSQASILSSLKHGWKAGTAWGDVVSALCCLLMLGRQLGTAVNILLGNGLESMVPWDVAQLHAPALVFTSMRAGNVGRCEGTKLLCIQLRFC